MSNELGELRSLFSKLGATQNDLEVYSITLQIAAIFNKFNQENHERYDNYVIDNFLELGFHQHACLAYQPDAAFLQFENIESYDGTSLFIVNESKLDYSPGPYETKETISIAESLTFAYIVSLALQDQNKRYENWAKSVSDNSRLYNIRPGWHPEDIRHILESTPHRFAISINTPTVNHSYLYKGKRLERFGRIADKINEVRKSKELVLNRAFCFSQRKINPSRPIEPLVVPFLTEKFFMQRFDSFMQHENRELQNTNTARNKSTIKTNLYSTDIEFNEIPEIRSMCFTQNTTLDQWYIFELAVHTRNDMSLSRSDIYEVESPDPLKLLRMRPTFNDVLGASHGSRIPRLDELVRNVQRL